jgi:ATP-dependent DNA ligase
MRAIVAAAGDHVRVSSCDGRDLTHRYPELAVLLRLVRRRPVLLDGKLVSVRYGRSDFGLLKPGCFSAPSTQT